MIIYKMPIFLLANNKQAKMGLGLLTWTCCLALQRFKVICLTNQAFLSPKQQDKFLNNNINST